MPSPPPPIPFPQSPNPSSFHSINPSILITILIISLTVIISVSLCLLLRLLRHRRTTSTPPPDSLHLFGNRISPENPTPLLNSLPLFTYSSISRRRPSSLTSAGDCSVCLSKFEPHDQLRLLPLCCHAFHVECIDTWLQSNQTCPLCRSQIHATESDLMKALVESSMISDANGGRSDSFRLELGSISRRQGSAASDSGRETRRSYSVGSFEYVVDEESEITMNHTHRRSVSDKEQFGGAMDIHQTAEQNLAAEVASGRSWLKDYVDRLSNSLSSRALSFRSSGRFFTGSSRRTEVSGTGECDLEANRIGEEISELFRWFSGV